MDDTSASTLPASRASRVLRVLVVEDLPRVRTALRELIEESPQFEVSAFAETEEEALQRFDDLRPDAVVVDLKLRSGTGLGVLHGIRARAPAPKPLLIVLTNHALPVLETACLQAGADHFLDKSRDFLKVRPLLEQARGGH
jgi:CheY-like chemotaxis protein